MSKIDQSEYAIKPTKEKIEAIENYPLFSKPNYEFLDLQKEKIA